MWSNNKQSDYPGAAPAQPAAQSPSQSNSFNSNAARLLPHQSGRAFLGAQSGNPGTGTHGEGTDLGEEDLQIDGKVEGPIALKGQRLTVGQNGEIVSDVHAREVIVYGKVRGICTRKIAWR